MDEFMQQIRVSLSEYIDTLHVIPFSVGNLLKFDPNFVLQKHIEGGKIKTISSIEEFHQLCKLADSEMN
jgi:hypothetical protein